MKILGISGLENSVPFKQKHWPALDPREYRISQGHDAAAALLIDGNLVAAAAQERFNRKKHAGDFPIDAVQYCLAAAGIKIEDVDEIAHGFDYLPYREIYSLDFLSSSLYGEVLSKDVLLTQLARYFPAFFRSLQAGRQSHG